MNEGKSFLKGVIPILQTPFQADGSIDYESLEREVEFCIQCGAHGLVIPANASEFFALSDNERKSVVEKVCDHVEGRVPVIASVSGLTARHAGEFAEHAMRSGVTAFMALPPYLRKSDNIVRYYQAIAAQTDGHPIIVQNAPGPLGTPISTSLMCELMESVPEIIYVKEEVPPIGPRLTGLLSADLPGLAGVFSGANGVWLTLELERGAIGCMPGAAMVDIQVKIYNLFQSGRRAEAEEYHRRLYPFLTLAQVYGVTCLKEVLMRRGVIRDASVRDPAAMPMDEYDKKFLDNTLSDLQDCFVA